MDSEDTEQEKSSRGPQARAERLVCQLLHGACLLERVSKYNIKGEGDLKKGLERTMTFDLQSLPVCLVAVLEDSCRQRTGTDAARLQKI